MAFTSSAVSRPYDLSPYADVLGVNLYEAWPDNPMHPEHTAEWMLGRSAISLLRKGEWPLKGRFGLEVWEQEIPSVDHYYHGSYRSPEEIGQSLLPMPPVRFDEAGNSYTDGEPAIALDDTHDLPIIRSLLNGKAPGLQDCGLVLARRKDANGQTHWFTTEEALARTGVGTVYIVWPERQLDKYVDPLLGRRDEYRLYRPACYEASVKTTREDLPGSLMVIDDSAPQARAFIDLVPEGHPKDISEALGVGVRPLGGVWPTRPQRAFPSLRVGR